MSLVQLTAHTGTTRTPVHQYHDPTFLELQLNDNQRVVQIAWERSYEQSRRTTVDWNWTAWIETRL